MGDGCTGKEAALVWWPDAVAPELLHEAATHRDMIFLNMTEGLYRCTRKYLEWLRLGPTLFPRARFFVLGDDDIYLSFSHLQASRPSLP